MLTMARAGPLTRRHSPETVAGIQRANADLAHDHDVNHAQANQMRLVPSSQCKREVHPGPVGGTGIDLHEDVLHIHGGRSHSPRTHSA
jgi:hypothetical protein